MGMAAGVGIAVALLEVAALSLSAAEVPHIRRARRRRAQMRPAQRRPAHLGPVAPQPHRDGQRRKQKGGGKDRHHTGMGEIGVKALSARGRQRAHRQHHRRHAQHQSRAQGHAAAVEQAAERSRPGIALPAFGADFGQGRGDVQGKGVRLGILAGVIAAAAVVAEIGQLREVRVAEGAFAEHRRKHVAIALAIAAGVADLRLAPRLGDGAGLCRGQIKRHGRRPPVPRSGRRRCRWSCRSRRDSPRPESSRP